MNKSVLVATSGGVDSACAIKVLLEDGFHVETLYLHMLDNEASASACRAAARIAEMAGVPFHEHDCRREFEREIIGYFVRSYARGLTPNPCVMCNPGIKIRHGLEIMEKLGLSYLATGHYARIVHGKTGPCLQRGTDRTKDQSYFLHRLGRESLSRIIFPLGGMLKTDVVKMASDAGFSSHVQQESQDVCFLERDYRAFLQEHNAAATAPGDMVTASGQVVGTHNGLHNYTVGQRRGLGLPGPEPTYVLRLDVERNQLVVGSKKELFANSLEVRNVNWLVDVPGLDQVPGIECMVKIRYRHEAVRAVATLSGKRVRVELSEPQRAVTPGQFAVFYQDEIVMGGGEICG